MSANVIIQFRRGTASAWSTANPTLANGEVGLETDTSKLKIGDGSTAWNSLGYLDTASYNNLGDLSDVTITSAADGDFLRWNGSAWINDAVNLGTDSVGDYVESLTAGTGVTLTNNTGEGATPTIAIGQSVGTTDDVTFNTVTTDAGITVGGHIVPDADVAYDLGSTTNKFRDLYLSGSSIELGGVSITSDGTTVSIPSLSTSGGLTGDLTGDVTGNADTATALETARTIQISGDVAGSASFDGTANINISATVQPDSVALGTDTTGNYTESVTGGTGVTVTGGTGEGNTPTVAIGQDVSTTADVTFNTVETTSNLTVGGNLTVNGTTTTINTTNLVVEDNIVTLNSNVTGAPSTNAGLEVERGDSTNVLLRWNETSDAWEWTNDGTNYYPLPTELDQIDNVSVSSPSDGDIIVFDSASGVWNKTTPDLTLSTGRSDVTVTNAATGDFLKWNGTAWVNDAINLGTDTVGDYVQNLTAGTGITLANNSGEGASPTVSIGQDVGTTADVQFNTVTGALVGNADTASTLETARTISLSGDVAGSVSFDGSGNVDISTTVQADSVALGTDTTGDYTEGVTGGTGVTVTGGTGEGNTPSIAIGQAVGTTDDVTFNTVTADLTGDVTGNADTATALETARTISLSGDVAGSVSFDGTSNVDITATIQADSVALGTDTTGDYTEGVTGGTGVTVTGGTGEGNTPSIAIGQAVGTTDNVTFNDVIVDGNLTVNGTTTTVNTETINLADNVIVINSNATGSATENGGLEVERGDDANVTLIWDETNDRWTVGTETFVAGTFIGDVTGDVTGNADTATALETARTISLSGDVAGSVSFDGTSNVDITATIQADSVALGTDTTGDYTEGVTGGTGVTVTGGTGEGNTPSIAIGQAVGTTDDVTFNTVTADLTGNVTGTVSDVSNHDLTDIGNVTITGASSGEFLKWDGSAWINASIPEINTLNDVGNVTITTASTGDILEWNGSAWVNTTLAFDDLSDVDMTSLAPSAGDIAYFDGSNWVPYPLTIQNSGGVSTASETTGDMLLYDGSNYVNTPHTLANTTDVNVVSPTDGQVLAYDSATSSWVNEPATATLEDLTDTTITSATEGDLLVYRTASGWVNEPPSTAHPLAY